MKDGTVIAARLLLVASFAGISGEIETAFIQQHSTSGFFAQLPEIFIQTILYGYLLLAWERRVENAYIMRISRPIGFIIAHHRWVTYTFLPQMSKASPHCSEVTQLLVENCPVIESLWCLGRAASDSH